MKLNKQDIIKSEDYVSWKDKWFNVLTHPATIVLESLIFLLFIYRDVL